MSFLHNGLNRLEGKAPWVLAQHVKGVCLYVNLAEFKLISAVELDAFALLTVTASFLVPGVFLAILVHFYAARQPQGVSDFDIKQIVSKWQRGLKLSPCLHELEIVQGCGLARSDHNSLAFHFLLEFLVLCLFEFTFEDDYEE